MLKLHGIGPVLAKKLEAELAKLHLTSETEAQLRKSLKHKEIFPLLPTATQMDLTENPDKLIPRQVIRTVNKELHKQVSGIRFTVAGSFRRNKAMCKDIDLVISKGKYKSPDVLWSEFSRQVNKSQILQLKKPYARGPSKISVIVTVQTSHARLWKIMVDAFLTSPNEYVYALLYATGSGSFNVRMRSLAKRKGYLLNQHGLFKGGKSIPAKNEKELFQILGMMYKTPSHRI